MASMAAVLSKTPFLSQPLTKSLNSDFPIAATTASVSFPTKFRGRRGGVRAGRIEPDGGKLVELFVEEPRRREKKHKATELPRVELTAIDLAIDDEQKARIGESKRVALVDSDGNPVAILSDIEIYKHPMEERI